MGEPVEAFQHADIRGRPCRNAWLVCLSDNLHGIHHQYLLLFYFILLRNNHIRVSPGLPVIHNTFL